MILVLDDEVQPQYRYLAPEITRLLPNAKYHVYVDEPLDPDLDSLDGIIISGSTASVYDQEHADWISKQTELIQRCIDEQTPLLGVCFGHQLINQALGGQIEYDRRRATFVNMNPIETDLLLKGINSIVSVLHADIVAERGKDMITTAQTNYSNNFCTRHANAPVWSVQFHPEFTRRIAGRPNDWDAPPHLFDKCNATQVLQNFAEICNSYPNN